MSRARSPPRYDSVQQFCQIQTMNVNSAVSREMTPDEIKKNWGHGNFKMTYGVICPKKLKDLYLSWNKVRASHRVDRTATPSLNWV